MIQNEWERGLPVPKRYIGKVDLCFYKLASILGYLVYHLGIRPNMITLCGFLCTVGTVISLYNKTIYYVITIPVYLLADTMDGYNARYYNQGTAFGAILDHTADWLGGTMFFFASFYRWYEHIYYYLFLGVILYLQYHNIVYCGYIYQYNNKQDIILSEYFQRRAQPEHLNELLVQYRNYNSSMVGLVLLTSFFILDVLIGI